MSLNIKNERTHALVRELARATGQSQTAAVEEAVRHRLDELSASGEAIDVRLERIQRIAADFQAALTPEDRRALLRADDDLYDHDGLPA